MVEQHVKNEFEKRKYRNLLHEPEDQT
jgi:hypothetical protein